MLKMTKKIFTLFMFIIVGLLLVSCIDSNNPGVKPPGTIDTPEIPVVPEPTENQLNLFYLNDTHGAVLNNGKEMGLANIANYIITKQETKKNQTIFVTGGDILQGQLISNTNKGAVMIESFNEMKLDAFIIGNHEFDWGLDVILNYFNDSKQDVKANFPLLGANVIEKATGQRPKGIDSHVIIERNGLKVGIVGAIGDGQESSISYRRVEPYKFTDAFSAIEKTVNEIKNEVDLILVGVHSSDEFLNNKIARLSKVQTIFNAHSHSKYEGVINGIPYLQSGSNGQNLGEVILDYEKDETGLYLLESQVNNLSSDELLLQKPNLAVEKIIDKYYKEIESLYTDVIITASEKMTRTKLANYIAKVMKTVTGSVAGFQNNGGTRNEIFSGQQLTAADIFQVFPFDNEIVYTEVPGSYLITLLNDSYFFIDSDISKFDINLNEYYRVATNDYVFYSSYNEFLLVQKGSQTVYGDMYEVFVEVLKELRIQGHKEFNSNSPILIGPNQIDFANYYYFNKKSYEVLYV